MHFPLLDAQQFVGNTFPSIFSRAFPNITNLCSAIHSSLFTRQLYLMHVYLELSQIVFSGAYTQESVPLPPAWQR